MPDKKKSGDEPFKLFVALLIAAICFGVFWFSEDLLFLIREVTGR